MTTEKKVPRGRFDRITRLATAGARVGASALLGSDGSRTAKAASEVLGTLRGLATKVGQMAAYVDGVVPEAQRESYEKWMTGLLAAAPTSSPVAIRKLVEEELGAPLGDLFSQWNDEPLASASIGQVHRAVMPDGRVVAVKVQHPGVAQALENDLKNAGLLEVVLATLGTRKFESKRILEEVRVRFREELDYRLEASRQKTFATIHAGDPTIRIPAIIDERSSRRVLTSDLVAGRSLDTARGAEESVRRAWCETLWRFEYKAILIGGLFNADPHPGNYFFQDNGAIAFVDFGCVQPIFENRRPLAITVHHAAIARDEESFRRNIRELLELRGGAYEVRALRYVRQCFEPYFGSPFRVTRPYVASLVDDMKELALVTRKQKDDQYVPMPEGMFFLNRLQFGFYSVLARLDAQVDYAAVEKAFLPAGFMK